MSVVQSKDFTWAPGMKTVCGSRFFGHTGIGDSKTEWWINPDGELWETDDFMNKCFEPDLDDGPTQGAIVFGVFAPLGFTITVSFGVSHDRDVWFVRSSGRYQGIGVAALKSLGPDFQSMADAIRAVFAALDSEAAR